MPKDNDVSIIISHGPCPTAEELSEWFTKQAKRGSATYALCKRIDNWEDGSKTTTYYIELSQPAHRGLGEFIKRRIARAIAMRKEKTSKAKAKTTAARN